MSALEVEDLAVGFPAPGGGWTEVVRRASFRVQSGEAVALVGESGAGKSLTVRAVLGLLPAGARILGGRVLLDGVDLVGLDSTARRRVRGRRIGLVPQEPGNALNPVLSIGAQLEEVARFHRGLDRHGARREARRLLGRMALPDAARIAAAFPHQLSGGQRQRVLLALALAARPAFLLADEPTTALDVTVQSQILTLLAELRSEFGIGLLLVAHDLAVVAATCSRAYVMYSGETVEEGPVETIFGAPAHPYTRGLLAALPRLGQPSPRGALPTISGQVPEPACRPAGCPFHPRCRVALATCRETPAPPLELAAGHLVRCHLHVDQERER